MGAAEQILGFLSQRQGMPQKGLDDGHTHRLAFLSAFGTDALSPRENLNTLLRDFDQETIFIQR